MKRVLLSGCLLALPGCALFFEGDPESTTGGTSTTAGTGGAGGTGAGTGAGGASTTGSGGAGGGTVCAGRTGDDANWAISFPDAELDDLVYAAADSRLYFAGRGRGGAAGLPGLASTPRVFVASVDKTGCDLVVHDLGPSDSSAEVRLAHGNFTEARVVWSRVVPDATSGTKGVLCAAPAADPGADASPKCSANATTVCATGGAGRFSEVAIAGSTPELITFRFPPPSSVMLDCELPVATASVGPSAYLFKSGVLTTMGNSRNVHLSLLDTTNVRMGALCNSGGILGGYSCAESGGAGAFRADYDLIGGGVSNYYSFMSGGDYQAVGTTGSQPYPSAHGVAHVSKFQTQTFRIIDSYAMTSAPVLLTADQTAAPTLRSVEAVGTNDELLLGGSARSTLGGVMCNEDGAMNCRDQAFWASVTPATVTGIDVFPVSGTDSSASSWANGALFVDGDVILGGGFQLGHLTFDAAQTIDAGSSTALYLARVAKP